jgi:acyl dehydratase
MIRHYLEDLTPGTRFELGPRHVTRAEIISFAAEFDPQPFHLDERAASTLTEDGLIASGWHVTSMLMRMLCESFMLEAASMGSPGIETLKWQKPVLPGDTLRGSSTVIDARVSKSRPEMGIVRFRHELTNQSDEIVMWMQNPILFARRKAAA